MTMTTKMKNDVHTFPTLVKAAAKGKVQQWTISVRANSDGTGTIITEHGQVNGAKQRAEDTIREGKNLGRKNATTPQSQAFAEAEAKWTEKQERDNYALTVEESAVKVATAPMLALKYQDHSSKVDWSNAYAQPKLDGNRGKAVRIGKQVHLWTREGVKVEVLQELEEALLSRMQDGDKWDGEFYIHGLPLAKINSLLRRRQDQSAEMKFNLYDTFLPLPYPERHELLRRAVPENLELVQLVKTVKVGNEDTLMLFQADCIEVGYEGAMLRQGSKVYEPGRRSDSLLKVKTFEDAEFKVVDCKEGRGSHEGMAIFVCETAAGNRFKVTAPGTHEEKKLYLQNKKLYIGQLLTVKYQCYTSTEKPVPFQPVAKNFKFKK